MPGEDEDASISKQQQQQQPEEPERKEAKPSSGQQRSRQMEHLARIRENVRRAIAAKHTFMIHGRSRVVREALLARGWCEKLARKSPGPGAGAESQQQQQELSLESSASGLLAGLGDLSEAQNERALVSRLLGGHTPDLLWNAGSDWSGWPAQDNKSTIFNRFSRASFTSKIGLCSNVRQMHWYYEAGVANTLFPRCYNISQAEQLQAFVEDFRLSACLSLLKWLLERERAEPQLEGLRAAGAAGPMVPLRALDFAVGRCSELIASRSHQDLDREPEKIWSHQWEQFLGWYYKLVHQQAGLLCADWNCLHKYLAAARHLLRKARAFWPQLDMDGWLNVWILKPGNKSRGRGIVLMNRLDDILAKLSPGGQGKAAAAGADTRFVVQKYIERPLLIYETKFDIRQWFLVTSAQPLTVWMYKQSYLRFCSQKFSLRDFHESIHLSNNAVQCKYKNSPEREAALPADNMWDVGSFKQWLAQRGQPDAWEQLVYPGMKQGLVGSLLASQEAMDRRKNSFELYGADFMLMDDLSVWLIEINSHPDMSSSTSVTSRLCRKAMDDIIKVVVDHRESPASADTGDFELVYKQRLSCCQAYLGTGLSLHGTRIQHDRRAQAQPSSANLPTAAQRRLRQSAKACCRPAGPSCPALVDLIEELELQLDREFHEYAKLRQSSGLARQSLPEATEAPPAPPQPPRQLDVQTNTACRTIDLGIVQSLSQSDAGAPAAQPQQRANLISKIIDLHKPRSRSPIKPPAAADKDRPARLPVASSNGKTRAAKDRKLNAARKRNSRHGSAAAPALLLDVADMYAVGLAVSK